MASRRQSLKALAKSRKMSARVYPYACMWSGRAAVQPYDIMGPFIQIDSHSREATTEGLRSALESMPLKRKGRG